MAQTNVKDLLSAGVHFGHLTRKWNPNMAPYIYGVREGVHVIDLNETVGLLSKALRVLENIVRDGGNVLFVGNLLKMSLLIGVYKVKF